MSKADKTKTVNRLFLLTVLWVLGASVGIGFLTFKMNLTIELLMALSQILYLFPVLLFLRIGRVKPGAWVPFQRLPVSAIAITILFTVLLMPLVTWLNMISMLFVENAFAGTQEEISENSFWLNLLTIAILPAFCEEFTFRGIYYHAYRQRGVRCAILGSALVFAMMHMNFNQFCYAFALGIALGLLLEATGSIFATMTAHFIVNGWSVFLTAILDTGSAVEGQAADAAGALDLMFVAIGFYTVIAAVSTCLAGAVLVWLARRCGRLEHLKWCFRRRPRKEGVPRTILTPAFLAAAAITVGMMIYAG